MGTCCAKQPKEFRCIMVGLDGVGKTTLLYRLKMGTVVTSIPTVGVNLETISHKGISFTICDAGRGAHWRENCLNMQAVIFLVDSNDKERIDDMQGVDQNAKALIEEVLKEESLKNAVVLVFANKQDLAGAMREEEVTQRLGLNKISGRPWLVQSCSVLSGDGVTDGIEWLHVTLTAPKKK